MNERERDMEFERRMEALGDAERGALSPEALDRIAGEVSADAALSARLDDLARAEAGAFDDARAGRVLDAVAEVFEPSPIPIERGVSFGVTVRRVAAIAAVIALGALVWVGLSRSSPTVQDDPGEFVAAGDVEDDMELLLELWDDSEWSIDLVDLSSDVSAVDDDVSSPWYVLETFEDSGLEGSI